MKVVIDNINGCHIFQGCKTAGGYGRVRVKGVHWMAHRYALSAHLGRPLLEGCVEQRSYVQRETSHNGESSS
ncbi:HNH endonuclease [Yersinia phage fPS-9]|uniref:Phage protein n=1 Tax=Yersinia phage fPS-9 TaxID=2052746 RepID=A0A2C9D019_9CAUD|nr:HNH endonuclease [Yersinia phage fPS-9]SOL37546.1 Phage protein [Yersinia phage fPS-9]